jgi:hypothetical protein
LTIYNLVDKGNLVINAVKNRRVFGVDPLSFYFIYNWATIANSGPVSIKPFPLFSTFEAIGATWQARPSQLERQQGIFTVCT